jgi:peptidoglycan/LPS O-acetylase OafA/YrhL
MTDDRRALTPTLRTAAKLAVLTGVCLAVSFAGVAIIQHATGEEEAWDTESFWPFALASGLLLGAVFARSGRRSAFFVGAVFAACVLLASISLSRDDEGANFGPLAVVFVGPWLALVVGAAAWLGGWAVAKLTTARRSSAR